MTESTRTSDNAGHSFSDATIAARVRAEPVVSIIATEARDHLIGDRTIISHRVAYAVIAAYRAILLADEPPLTDEQRIERSAP